MDSICLRPMTEADSERLFAWRSDSRVYRYLRNPSPPTPEQHARWLKTVLVAQYYRGFIIDHVEHGPVGQCSLTYHGDRTEIGIYVAPEYWGRGFGHAAIELLKRLAKDGGVWRLEAVVHAENCAAQGLYAKAGFAGPQWVTMVVDLTEVDDG